MTQEQQVVEMMRKAGGYATLRRLNEVVDYSAWKTKTPEATIRRIVQVSKQFFRIQPGLWALEEFRDEVLRKFELKPGNKQSEEQFSHGYYQGLLVEIGKFRHQMTYIPAQDQNRKFIGQRLGDITDTTELPTFTYEKYSGKRKPLMSFGLTNVKCHQISTKSNTRLTSRIHSPSFTSCKTSMQVST